MGSHLLYTSTRGISLSSHSTSLSESVCLINEVSMKSARSQHESTSVNSKNNARKSKEISENKERVKLNQQESNNNVCLTRE